jgi:hypothetical protein
MMMVGRRRLTLCLLGASAVGAAALAAASFGASGTGAVATFSVGRNKIDYSGSTTPTSAYSDIGRLQLPVGSWVITAHTVVQLSPAAAGTVVECFLSAPNAQTGYTTAGLSPAKGQDLAQLSAQTVSNAPNGGNADLVCRVNTRADGKLVKARATSIVGTSVDGASVSLSKPPF